MQTQDYKINLALFEGPLDLLLHLIKKEDVNIYDIPLSHILDQYVAYLDMMKELDIDLAGEFVLMAAELSHIKSRLLLFQEKGEDENEGPDPRADLVARLLVYQRYKFASDWLLGRPLLNRDVFKRPEANLPEEAGQEKERVALESFALLSAFHEILKRLPAAHVHEVQMERVSVADRIYEILEKLKRTGDSVLFANLFEDQPNRGRLVLTFLAILEMARLKMIQIYQTDLMGTIRVIRTMETIYGENRTQGDS